MEKKRRRRRADKKKRLILLLDGVLLLALVVAAVVLVTSLTGDGKKRAQAAAATPEPTGADVIAPQQEALPAEPGAAPEAASAVDAAAAYAALKDEGVDVLAWLSCEGTAIQYPVVQNMDDEYYMTRDVYGKKDNKGAISLDGRNSAALADSQIMIYGNAMADGSMFGSLVSYQDPSYFAQHPTMTLYTPTQSYTIRIFAAHLASPEMANYPTWFATAEDRAAYLQSVGAKSFLSSDLTIPEDAQLVSLVTNSAYDAGENSRFVVHGVLEKN